MWKEFSHVAGFLVCFAHFFFFFFFFLRYSFFTLIRGLYLHFLSHNLNSFVPPRYWMEATYRFVLGVNQIKVCVRYFLSNFYFFTKWEPFKNHEKCFLFHLKSSVRFWDIQIFVIFSFSTLSRFKRTNGSGIIYDVINWLV